MGARWLVEHKTRSATNFRLVVSFTVGWTLRAMWWMTNLWRINWSGGWRWKAWTRAWTSREPRGCFRLNWTGQWGEQRQREQRVFETSFLAWEKTLPLFAAALDAPAGRTRRKIKWIWLGRSYTLYVHSSDGIWHLYSIILPDQVVNRS